MKNIETIQIAENYFYEKQKTISFEDIIRKQVERLMAFDIPSEDVEIFRVQILKMFTARRQRKFKDTSAVTLVEFINTLDSSYGLLGSLQEFLNYLQPIIGDVSSVKERVNHLRWQKESL